MPSYDLEERTTVFSEKLIDFYKKCPKSVVTMPLIDQGLRSGTSIGANYCEANGASSKKDFKNKILPESARKVPERTARKDSPYQGDSLTRTLL